MKTQISVIIPAYNIKEYLPNCLDSVLAQDFTDYEIIVIDDGSTDGTAEVCNRYQKLSNKISILHQKNAGLSSARNIGIEHAKGEYLAFVDGDDIISPNFLSKFYEAAVSTHAEVVVCGFLEFYSSQPLKAVTDEYCKPKIVSGPLATMKLLIGQENYDIVVWNKLYKRKLFENIKFPVGELHEDTLTTYKLLAAASRVANINDVLYFYRKRKGSIMAEQDLKKRLEIKERAANEAIAYFENNPELKQAAEVALLLSKFAYLDNIASGKIHDRKLWQETIKEINSSRKNYKTNPYLTKKLKLYLTLLKTPVTYKTFRKIIHE